MVLYSVVCWLFVVLIRCARGAHVQLGDTLLTGSEMPLLQGEFFGGDTLNHL